MKDFIGQFNFILVTGVIILISATAAISQTANPNATAQTKSILSKISALGNSCEFMLGQNLRYHENANSYYQDDVIQLQNNTGEFVPMLGLDHGFNQSITNTQLYDVAETHWNSNGLVTIAFHPNNPWTDNDSWDNTNQHLKADLLDPTKDVYNVWQSYKNEWATILLELQSRNITVLLRPLHEANGEWFWWGHPANATNNSDYRALWIDLFNYLTYTRSLNNLIWIYCTAESWNGNETNFLYPGSQYVDMSGLDIYQTNLDWVETEDFTNLINLDKPFAITEFGPAIPNPTPTYNYTIMNNWFKSNYPEVTYILAWHSWEGHNNALIDNLNAGTVLSDNCHVNVGNACPVVGSSCNDGDPNTINDSQDGSCNCAGVIQPTNCELIINGDFSSAGNSWVELFHNGGNGSNSYSNNESRVTIVEGGAAIWSIQLYQENLNIQQGKMYQLSFDARAMSNRSISVEVGENGDDYSSYFIRNQAITASWSTYQYVFQAGQNDPVARFVFHLGLSSMDVFIDDVSLVELNCGSNSCTDGVQNNGEYYVDCGGPCQACNDCPYANKIVSENPVPGNLHLKLDQWIESDGVVQNSSDVKFSAGDRVELLPNFKVELGAEFTAMIESCN